MANRFQSVLLLCVNYKNEKDTLTFVKSIIKQKCTNLLKVIVVNNGEGENAGQYLLKLHKIDSRVNIMYPGRNLGYFGAVAWGLRQYLINRHLPDWIIVSNTDMSFKYDDFFEKLFLLYSDKTPAVIAPTIYSTATGINQNPHLLVKPSKMKLMFLSFVFKFYPSFIVYSVASFMKNKVYYFYKRIFGLIKKGNSVDISEPKAIYSPHGSFIIFHRSYFEVGGNLEHGTFMFGEEITVAEKAKRLKLSVIYEPRLVVLHHEHATTGFLKSRRIARYQWEASVYCLKSLFS